MQTDLAVNADKAGAAPTPSAPAGASAADVQPQRTAPAYDLLVYVARLQPVLRLHLEQLRYALTLAPACLVVVAGARQALSPRNPLTLEQRVAMLWHELREDERAHVQLVAARDSYDTASWSDAVQRAARATAPQAARYAVLYEPGSREPALPWAQVVVSPHAPVRGPSLLDPVFAAAAPPVDANGRQPASDTAAGSSTAVSSATDSSAVDSPVADSPAAGSPAAQIAALASVLTPQGAAALQAWSWSAAFARLAREWHALRAMRAEWAGSPYPPVFVTVDVVVQCGGKLLLIRRGRKPGKDLYALPGGFIEVAETLAESALRELAEETGLELDAPELRGALRGSAVFDAPGRSQRGRVITHAYYFDLGQGEPPAIQAGDDAAAAFWLPLDELAEHETEFHDDHFLIIDHFLDLAGSDAVALTTP